MNDASDLKMRDTELPRTRFSRRQRARESARKGLLWSWRAAKYTFNRLIRSRFTPHQIALGAAIGVFVAWTPTIGLQMAIAVPICLFFRANPVAAIPPIWITNPVTAVPIYGFNYKVGRFLMGGPNFREFSEQMKAVYRAMSEDGVWASLELLFQTGEDVFWPLVMGSVLVGLILALALYPATYFLVRWLRSKRKIAAHPKEG